MQLTKDILVCTFVTISYAYLFLRCWISFWSKLFKNIFLLATSSKHFMMRTPQSVDTETDGCVFVLSRLVKMFLMFFHGEIWICINQNEATSPDGDLSFCLRNYWMSDCESGHDNVVLHRAQSVVVAVDTKTSFLKPFCGKWNSHVYRHVRVICPFIGKMEAINLLTSLP